MLLSVILKLSSVMKDKQKLWKQRILTDWFLFINIKIFFYVEHFNNNEKKKAGKL